MDEKTVVGIVVGLIATLLAVSILTSMLGSFNSRSAVSDDKRELSRLATMVENKCENAEVQESTEPATISITLEKGTLSFDDTDSADRLKLEFPAQEPYSITLAEGCNYSLQKNVEGEISTGTWTVEVREEGDQEPPAIEMVVEG